VLSAASAHRAAGDAARPDTQLAMTRLFRHASASRRCRRSPGNTALQHPQRTHQRVDVAGRVRAVLRHHDQEPAIEVVNISRTGAALKAGSPIGAVPERAELRMHAGDGSEWISCPCELRYILGENRPDGEPAWLHGVRFTELTQSVQDFIDGLLARTAAV
jgi:hypothetical protein